MARRNSIKAEKWKSADATAELICDQTTWISLRCFLISVVENVKSYEIKHISKNMLNQISDSGIRRASPGVSWLGKKIQ